MMHQKVFFLASQCQLQTTGEHIKTSKIQITQKPQHLRVPRPQNGTSNHRTGRTRAGPLQNVLILTTDDDDDDDDDCSSSGPEAPNSNTLQRSNRG